jgi:hypothetical protein
MRSRDVETPRSRSLVVPLLLGLFLPQLLLRLPAVTAAGPLALHVPSVEAFLLAAVVGISARRWPEGRRIVPPIAAVLVEFLFVFSITDALLSRFFNRPLALATDFGYLPALYGLMRDTAPRAWFVGGLVLLPLALVALGYGLARLYGLYYRAAAERRSQGRVARVVLLGLCGAVAAAGLLPGTRARGSTVLPRLAGELASVLSSRRYVAERREEFQALVATEPARTRALDRLESRDVFLFIVESYGYTLYSEPQHFALAEPFLRRLEARLEGAGYRIVSNFLSSPAFGGNSWLADSTLAAGVRIADQAAYDTLLESQVKPMAAWFNEAGYRTVNSMPATTSSWPEGEYYQFQQKYYYRDFGYRGPGLKWAPMTDQFAVRVIHEREVAPAREPLFVQYVMISGHYPFSLIPRLFEDWSELGDGSVYSAEGAVRVLPIPAGAATAGAAGYAAVMEYQLGVVSDYTVRFLAGRRALIVVVGDHQPYSGITGKGKLRSVPIHVLSREAAVLEPFLRRGYTPGLVPRQPLPHAGLESFLPALLEDLTSPVAGDAGR